LTPTQFREARRKLGLTQTQAACLLGYGNRVRISEIENGHEKPGAAVVRLLRAYLAGYRPEDWPK
jgi:transcriptional regulator with XRE-family HTH domain